MTLVCASGDIVYLLRRCILYMVFGKWLKSFRLRRRMTFCSTFSALGNPGILSGTYKRTVRLVPASSYFAWGRLIGLWRGQDVSLKVPIIFK